MEIHLRFNDHPFGEYTQASGKAEHPKRMMIWSDLIGNYKQFYKRIQISDLDGTFIGWSRS